MTIHLTLVDPAPQRGSDLAVQAALRVSGLMPGQTCEIRRAPNGKPWLDFASRQMLGFSTSYTRLQDGKLALIALVEGCDAGVDVELWPTRGADRAFLDTVSAPEDANALASLGKSGHDAGVALWVIKEAALKCSGEVMTDPRNLAVTPRHDGLHRVNISKRAGAPHPDIDVALYALKPNSGPEIVLLAGVALAAGNHFVDGRQRAAIFSHSRWNLSKI